MPVDPADSYLPTSCPACGMRFIRPLPLSSTVTDGMFRYNYSFPMQHGQPAIRIDHGDNLEDHARQLASAAQLLQDPDADLPHLRVLMVLLQQARSFVHLTSYGISQYMIGVLRAVAQRVEVAGIVAGIDPNERREIEGFGLEAPGLQIHIAEGDSSNDRPHQKLLVVDGLVAVHGSPNLTQQAWRKVAKGMELSQVATSLQQVTHLNNRFFAPFWARGNETFDPHKRTPEGWTYQIPEDFAPQAMPPQ